MNSLKKREKILSVRSVRSTDLCTQLLVARDGHEFPARPRRASFSEAMQSCTELAAILQYFLRKIDTRVTTKKCNMLEKFSDYKLSHSIYMIKIMIAFYRDFEYTGLK